MIPARIGQIPVKKIVPKDVFRSVQNSIAEVRRIKDQLVIEDPIDPTPLWAARRPRWSTSTWATPRSCSTGSWAIPRTPTTSIPTRVPARRDGAHRRQAQGGARARPPRGQWPQADEGGRPAGAEGHVQGHQPADPAGHGCVGRPATDARTGYPRRKSSRPRTSCWRRWCGSRRISASTCHARSTRRRATRSRRTCSRRPCCSSRPGRPGEGGRQLRGQLALARSSVAGEHTMESGGREPDGPATRALNVGVARNGSTTPAAPRVPRSRGTRAGLSTDPPCVGVPLRPPVLGGRARSRRFAPGRWLGLPEERSSTIHTSMLVRMLERPERFGLHRIVLAAVLSTLSVAGTLTDARGADPRRPIAEPVETDSGKGPVDRTSPAETAVSGPLVSGPLRSEPGIDRGMPVQPLGDAPAMQNSGGAGTGSEHGGRTGHSREKPSRRARRRASRTPSWR